MSCRLPGANDLDQFWRNLAAGVESITRFTEPGNSFPGYVNAAPVLDDPGGFDAAFFGYSPMEARTIDPQQRILLELAHEALEHAGYDPERYAGRIGVFGGSALNTYYAHVGLHTRIAEDYIPTLIANDKDFLATRISYKLNLKGPSLTVQTACSTSLVAVHLARQSLLSGETDMALVGAISVRVPHRAGYVYDGAGVVSPDGRVRAFDAGANGTVFGSRRRRARAQAAGRRARRRRQHSCADQGIRSQQRRLRQGRLFRAQRRGAGRRRGRGAGQCRGRRRRRELHRGARLRHAGRRSDRGDRAHQGVPRLHAAAGLLRARLGEDQPRAPRRGRGARRPDQDRARAQAPADSAEPALHRAEPGNRFPLDAVLRPDLHQ